MAISLEIQLSFSPGAYGTLWRVCHHPPHVTHPSGSAAFAFRLETGDRLIAYSGDTGWTDTLVEVARDADLFIVECYAYDGPAENHINYRTLEAKQSFQVGLKRLLLTHLSRECSTGFRMWTSRLPRTGNCWSCEADPRTRCGVMEGSSSILPRLSCDQAPRADLAQRDAGQDQHQRDHDPGAGLFARRTTPMSSAQTGIR